MANAASDATFKAMLNAKKGEEVTLPGGKVIISDGRGGGKTKRTVKKPVAQSTTPNVAGNNRSTAAAQPAAPLVARPIQGATGGQGPDTITPRVKPNAQQPVANTPVAGKPLTPQGSTAAKRGNTLRDLIELGKGKPR
jgi:hypothetical protein